MKIGKLRHRITIQSPVETQNTETGEMVITWQNHLSNVPAEITPASVKEFIAARTINSEISSRIVIRFRNGLTAKMRIVHNGQIYLPVGWLPDNKSGMRYLTAPCIVTEGDVLQSEESIFQDTEDAIFQDTEDAIFQDIP